MVATAFKLYFQNDSNVAQQGLTLTAKVYDFVTGNLLSQAPTITFLDLSTKDGTNPALVGYYNMVIDSSAFQNQELFITIDSGQTSVSPFNRFAVVQITKDLFNTITNIDAATMVNNILAAIVDSATGKTSVTIGSALKALYAFVNGKRDGTTNVSSPPAFTKIVNYYALDGSTKVASMTINQTSQGTATGTPN